MLSGCGGVSLPCIQLQLCQRWYGSQPEDVARFGAISPCSKHGAVRCIRLVPSASWFRTPAPLVVDRYASQAIAKSKYDSISTTLAVPTTVTAATANIPSLSQLAPLARSSGQISTTANSVQSTSSVDVSGNFLTVEIITPSVPLPLEFE